MPVTMDTGHNITNVVESHFPTPEARAGFDNYLTQLKAARMTGKLGTDPQEQSTLIQSLIKERYPQMFPGEFKPPSQENTPERDAYVAQYKQQHPGPFLDNVPQFLAERGVIEQPKTFGQQYVYPALTTAAETTGAVGGAMAGAPGGPFVSAIGAGTGAMITRGVADPLLRSYFDLPQDSAGQQVENAVTTFAMNSVFDLLGSAGSRLASYAKKAIFFGRNAQVTGDMLDQLNLLQQGSNLAGNNAFPAIQALSLARRTGTEPPPTLTSWFTNLVNSSLTGPTQTGQRASSVQQAMNALVTDWVRQFGRDGAMLDSAQVAETLRQVTGNNYQISRTLRRQVYDAAETFPGRTNPIPSDNLVTFMHTMDHRIDLAHVASDIEQKTNIVNKDVMDYFQKVAPLSPQTPVGTPLPDFDVSAYPSVTPGSAVYQGMSPQGNAMIQVTTPSGPLQIPVNPQTVTVRQNITSYRDLREIYSLLNKYANEMQERAGQSATDAKIREFSVYARDARYLAKMVKDHAEDAAIQGHFPLQTLRAYNLADKFAAEEVETFQNKLTARILSQLGENPHAFAQEMIKPHNAEVLKNIQKAVDSLPDVSPPHQGMSVQDLESEIARPSLYRPDLTRLTWEHKIQPQIQAEFMAQSLEAQSGKAFEQALGEGNLAGQSQVGSSPESRVVLNGAKLRASLEGDFLLDPQTRKAYFGSEQNYQRWVSFSKLLENFDQKKSAVKAGIGSFMMVTKQSAGLTMVGYSAYHAFSPDDHPNTPLLLLGGALLLTPLQLVRTLNKPSNYRELVLGLKQTPQNFLKTRIATQLTQNSMRELEAESEKRYPVLPGESR